MKKLLFLISFVSVLSLAYTPSVPNNENDVQGKGGKAVGCAIGAIGGGIASGPGGAAAGCTIGGAIGDWIGDEFFNGFSVKDNYNLDHLKKAHKINPNILKP